ncbi:MAG: NADH-quinone oxidoreductase subunit K [Longimicrobiales bacterium]
MTPLVLYACAGAALFVVGLHALVTRAHLFWKVLAVNIMAGGIFLVLITAPPRLGAGPDPVPQAMVLTGIVVAVASTALALGLALRVAARTGRPFLEEEVPDPGPYGAEEEG